MNKIIFLYLLLVSITIFSCKNQVIKEKVDRESNVIPLSVAISQERPVKLSEIVDSVSYMPLSNKSLVAEKARIAFSDRFIYIGASVFDWSGNYLFDIGSRGQGVGEEVYLHTIVDVGNSFYSMADKLIAYNSRGRYAGRERLVIDWHFLDMGRLDTTGLITCTLDTLYFLLKDFTVTKTMRVVPDWPEKSVMMSSNRNLRFFTTNEDSVLYYNYINDTIYRVTQNEIQPRWVIDLEDDKIAPQYLLGNEMKRLGIGSKYFENGNLSDWEYLKDTDNKVRIFSVFESQDYVFMYWFRMFDFWQLRHLPATVFQLAYYNKQTGHTVAVSKEGIIDDISSLGSFYPLEGIHGNCMVSFYWPFELMEKVKELQQKGKIVDSKLLEVLKNVDEEDNPIVVKAYLKSN